MAWVRDAVSRFRSQWSSLPGVRRTLLLDWAIRDVLITETRSAVLLLFATAAALAWANLAPGNYLRVWDAPLGLSVAGVELREPLRAWVNDGLMALWFYVIGLDLRYELERGELREFRTTAVAVCGAVGGATLAPLLFLAINAGEPTARAWGVVVASDSAFALGVLALVGSRAPPAVRLFVLALAVADDVIAVLVIALAYSTRMNIWALGLAALLIAAILLLLRAGVWRSFTYVLFGVALWLAALESGIHPVIVGVVLGLLTPARHPSGDRQRAVVLLTDRFLQQPTPAHARGLRIVADAAVSANARLQYLLRPWAGFVVMPIFAVANAGVHIDGELLAGAVRSPLAWGIVVGLVVGQSLGIAAASYAASRVRGWSLPGEMSRRHIPGVAAVSAIGFTVSLFIIDLALADPHQRAVAKTAVLAAGLVASGLGWLAFYLASRSGEGPERQLVLTPEVDPRVDHIRGPRLAPVTLVEFGDFECPYCADGATRVRELRRRHGDRLRFVFRHLPITGVHPRAELAARAAEAAARQGAFWPMHDRLFADQEKLGRAEILASARELGLDVERFAADLDSDEVRRRVELDLSSAEASGVSGVPTFFVNGRLVPRPLELLPRAVNAALAAPSSRGAGATAGSG